MPDFLHIDLVQLVQLIGYPGIATIIFLESGVFFGFFLPGGSLLFTAGVLASASIFNIWILLPLLISAAILGDNAGYWFGAKVGIALFKREDSRFFKKAHVERAQAFFDRYGKRTVVLARFVPVVRTFVPILAGVGSMDYRVFFFYNTLGAFLWAGGVTSAGYFLGRVVPDAEKYLPPIILAILVFSSIPLIFEWWRRHAPISKCPRAILFDLDNTLAESFQTVEPETAENLRKLLSRVPVAIMSGATFERMQAHVLSALPTETNLANLYLFPDTASRCYTYASGAWQRTYNHVFTAHEYANIVTILKEGLEKTAILKGAPQYGERVLARENQVTLAAIGVDATAEAKAAWDPTRKKRAKLRRFLKKKLPGFDIRISGRTAIDITRQGIDKAHGVRWLAEHIGVDTKEMLFIGDDLKPGGNDAVVIPTGIRTHEVSKPEQTTRIIKELCALCEVS
jgi:membrane-associated protein